MAYISLSQKNQQGGQPQQTGYVPLAKKKNVFQRYSDFADRFSDKAGRFGVALNAGIVQGVGSVVDLVGGNVLRAEQKLIDKVAKPIPAAQKFVEERPKLKKTLEFLAGATDIGTSQEVRAPYKSLAEKSKKIVGITPENQSYWEQVAESFGYSVPALGAGLATGGLGGAVLAGGIEAGSEAQSVADDLLGRGYDRKMVNKRAAATFASNAVLNTVTNKLGYLSQGIQSPVKKFVVSALSELGQEDAQQVISNIAANRPMWQGIKETTLLALPQTLVFGGAGVLSQQSNISSDEKEELKRVEDTLLQGAPAFKKANYVSLSEQKKPTEIFHGSQDGKLAIDRQGNVNFATRPEAVAPFAGPEGKTVSGSLDGLNVRTVNDEAELFDAASTQKDALLKEGVDAVRFGDRIIAINLEKTAQTLKAEISPDIRQMKITEIEEQRQENVKQNLENLRANGFDHVINDDGTFTLFHKTTADAARKIDRSGFAANSFFADSAEAADAVASTNKKGMPKTVEIKVDPADIFYNSSTNEFEASEPLIRGKDGVYRSAQFKRAQSTVADETAQRGLERLARYKKQHNLSFDIYIADKILTPEGGQAEGVTYDNTITLAQNISKYAADHEFFHLVFRNFERIPLFNNFTRSELYQELRQKYGDLSREQLEEKMAEGFEQYAKEQELNKKTSFTGQIERFFAKLYDSVHDFFAVGKEEMGTLKELYQEIYYGEGKQSAALKNTGNARQRFKEGTLSFQEGDVAQFKEVPDDTELLKEENIPSFREMPEELINQATYLDIMREALTNNPAKQLEPYIVKSGDFEGGLPEVLGKKPSELKGGSYANIKSKKVLDFIQRGDQIVSEIFNTYDTGRDIGREEAQDILAQYLSQKGEYKTLLNEYRRSLKQYKLEQSDAKAVEAFLNKQTKITEQIQKQSDAAKAFRDRLVARGFKQGEKAGIKIGRVEGKNIRENIIAELRRTFELKELKTNILSQNVQRIKSMIREYVTESLPIAERGRFLTVVSNAKTQNDLGKAFSRVDTHVADLQKKEVVTDLKKMYSRILDSQQIDVDYKDKIKEIFDSIDLVKRTEGTINKLKNLKEFVEASGSDVFIPQYAYDNLKILERKPVSELSYNELANIKNSIEMLHDIGVSKKHTRERLYDMEKEQKKQTLLDSIVPLEKNPELKRIPGQPNLTFGQRFKNIYPKVLNFFQHLDLATKPMDIFFDMLDGSPGTFRGNVYRLFKSNLDTKFGNYLAMRDSVLSPIRELADTLNLTRQNFERIGIHAARAQEDGIEKLLNSDLTQEYIDSIVLTKDEMKLYDAMREQLDKMREPIAQTMKNVYNKPVGKVKNYFSFMTDFEAMNDVEVFQRIGQDAPEFGRPTKTVEQGFTKARTGGKQKIKLNAMDIFTRHIDNATYLVNTARDIKMLSEISNSGEFGDKAGEVGQKYVIQWLDLLARKGGKAGTEKIDILDTLRKNIGVGYLGFKLSSAIIQPTALLDGASMIGSKAFTGAIDVGSKKSVRQFILKNMPELRNRIGDDIAYTEFSDNKPLSRIQNAGLWVLKNLDGLAASSVAWGAYNQKMEELGLPIDLENPNKQAIEYAERIVRNTQSSPLFKDTPLAISRGVLTGNRSFDKAFLQFQSFVLNRWHRFKHLSYDSGIKQGRFKPAFNQVLWLILSALAEEGLRRASKELIALATGEDVKYNDGYSNAVAKQVLGTMPFVGQGIGIATYGGEAIPALGAPIDVIKGIASGDAPDILGGVGAGFGIPGSKQVAQFISSAEKASKKKTSSSGSSGLELPELPSLSDFGLPTLPELPSLPTL